MKLFRKIKAVTLVELLVVAIVVGILAAAAVPQYQKVMQQARDKEVIGVVQALASAELRYLGENGDFYPNENGTLSKDQINNLALGLGHGGIPNQDYCITRNTDNVVLYARNDNSRIWTMTIPYSGTPGNPTFTKFWPKPVGGGEGISEKPEVKPEDIGGISDDVIDDEDDSSEGGRESDGGNSQIIDANMVEETPADESKLENNDDDKISADSKSPADTNLIDLKSGN